jgi:hypothetical protein
VSEKEAQEKYVPHRFSKKQSFCLSAGLKIQRLRRDYGRGVEERRGIFRLSDAQKLLEKPHA